MNFKGKTLGQMITEARSNSGLSYRELGNLIGISHTYVNQIEKGTRLPSDEVLQSLAAALGLNIDVLRTKAFLERLWPQLKPLFVKKLVKIVAAPESAEQLRSIDPDIVPFKGNLDLEKIFDDFPLEDQLKLASYFIESIRIFPGSNRVEVRTILPDPESRSEASTPGAEGTSPGNSDPAPRTTPGEPAGGE